MHFGIPLGSDIGSLWVRFGGLSWPMFEPFSTPVSVLSSTWFLTRFSTFCRAMFQVKLKAKNEQKPWRVCNFYYFRLSASEPLPSAFGELFWSRFGRQDGPKIDPKAHPEPTPKTTLQNDPKTAQHGPPKPPQDPPQNRPKTRPRAPKPALNLLSSHLLLLIL